MPDRWKSMGILIIFIALFIVILFITIKNKIKEITQWKMLAKTLDLNYIDEPGFSSKYESAEAQKDKMLSSIIGKKIFQINKKLGKGHITGRYNSIKVKMLMENRSFGDPLQKFYLIEVLFDKPLEVKLHIYHGGLFRKVSKFFRFNELFVSWEDLDELVMIKSDNVNEVKHFILNTRGFLNALKELFLSGEAYTITEKGIFYESQDCFFDNNNKTVFVLNNITDAARRCNKR